MTIVETRPITGGVDTHLDVHVAAALDANGGVLGVESFATTPPGYRRAARVAGGVRAGRPGRGGGHRRLRRRSGPAPARLRGRGDRGRSAEPSAASTRRASPTPSTRSKRPGRRCRVERRRCAKTADGNVEAMRALLVAKRSARETRIKCLNQIRHLGFTAPDELRERFRGVPRDAAGRTRRRAATRDLTATR